VHDGRSTLMRTWKKTVQDVFKARCGLRAEVQKPGYRTVKLNASAQITGVDKVVLASH
jgi:hypothetical protein